MDNVFIRQPTIEFKLDGEMPDVIKQLLGAASQPTSQVEFTTRIKRWQFPKERFVTYEPSDESWCRYFGIGQEVEVVESTVFPQAVLTSVGNNEYRFKAIGEITCMHTPSF